jgi:hypothetical protein
MFVKKNFSIGYAISCEFQWPPTNFISFFAYEYQKHAEFYADSKSIEVIGKSALKKSYLPITFAS